MKALSFLARVILPLVVAFAVGFGVAAHMYKQNAPTASPSAKTVTVTLIGNRNTKKLHLSTCSSVDDMAEKNKVSFHSYTNAENNGYVPCKKCRPDLNWTGN